LLDVATDPIFIALLLRNLREALTVEEAGLRLEFRPTSKLSDTRSKRRGTVEADGGQRFVFVVLRNALGVGKATLQKREIRVGIADATNYEVLSGLQEGEMVALPGDVDLKDGMPVRIVNTDASYIRGRSESN